ncbi:MAG: hypothetical protein ACRDSH_23675 [Pseudonocardiaceae bacterium]
MNIGTVFSAPGRECEEPALIPRNTFGDNTPMREIDRWAHEEMELAARHGDRAQKRRRYVDSLIKAINGDLDGFTLGEAERRFWGGNDD